MNSYYVYILANKLHSVLYIGVTNDIYRRVAEHRAGLDSFTKKYGVHHLVYYETYSEVRLAIEREKELKGWNRFKKERLVKESNPHWEDLAKGWHGTLEV